MRNRQQEAYNKVLPIVKDIKSGEVAVSLESATSEIVKIATEILSREWSREKVIVEAQREPERLKFWQKYHDDYYEACLAVVENPSSFDRIFALEFPRPEDYKRKAAK